MDSLSTVRVVIADDHPLVRAGVMTTLQACEQFQVVGQSKNAEETLELVRAVQPELLILDLEMEDYRPARLIDQCAQLQPSLKILILSRRCVPRDMELLAHANVHGFVDKLEPPECLLQAARVVLAGDKWFSHEVLERLTALRSIRQHSPVQQLSIREQQVLEGLMQARDNQAIADSLQISKHTVRRYITQIFQKLYVKNRMEAIVWASQNGFRPDHKYIDTLDR